MNTNSNAPRVAVTGYYFWQNSSLFKIIASRPFLLKKIVRQILRPDAAATHAAFMASLGDPPTLSSELVGAGLLHADELRDELIVDRETVGICYSSSKNEYIPNAFWRCRSAFYPNAFVVFPNDTLENGVPRTADYAALSFARQFKIGGPILSPVAACATGTHCIGLGTQIIRWGQAQVVLAGAQERVLNPLLEAGYRQIGALSQSKIMRPFDKRRDGFVPAQGDGLLILENEEHARKRGAKIYGYVTGYDMGVDATSLTGMNPSGVSIARAMERALKRAGNPKIDYINAHGTATPLNDAIESRAIKSVFGNSVPVSSTKPLTGHLLGAAGAVEAAICLQALRENWAPPTLNLEEADDQCDLDYIPLTSDSCGRDMPLQAVMSLNYGFGGHIGVLIFEKAD